MKVLDLFCGAGGSSNGLEHAGFVDITGIDIFTQLEYLYKFIQDDVIRRFTAFPEQLKEFDFIWASPPCQAYTFASKKSRNLGKIYPDLIKQTREILLRWGGPFVIENVTTAPIRKDLILCGEMFKLKVIRHRAFEIHGFKVPQLKHKKHKGTVKQGFYVTVAGHGGDGKASLKVWQKAMGINWITDKKMLAEAVPPKYAEYIGEQFLKKCFLKK